MLFKLNEKYINRKGEYTVLEINPPKMLVRYEDGTTTELNIAIQERIWENILVEQEAQAARRSARANRAGSTNKTQHFIKAVSIPSLGEFSFPGWPERVILATDEEAAQINPGDRIIYYAIETQNFIAVATITGPAFIANPKEYFYKTNSEAAHFFSVDLDAVAHLLTGGVMFDSIELESQPNFTKLKLWPEQYLKINEDDFELLAEILTEIAESDEEEEFEEEDFLEEDEE